MSQGEVVKRQDAEAPKRTAVDVQAEVMESLYTIVQFRNRPMVLVDDGYPHFVPLTRERFDRMFYATIKGQTRSRVGDVFAQVSYSAEDLTDNERYILFGREDALDDETYHRDAVTRVWDTHRLEFVEVPPAKAVWRSPFGVVDTPTPQPIPFVMSLAGNDPGKYEDIMQSLAPLVMDKKPDGVIWWVGDGANGKSTLMDAIYRIFPGQLSSITVKRLVDGRDTPSLNGTLGNVVKESSEGRVDDTEVYKAIGTHEDFRVHKFHSQDDITIRGNLHHIFSANNIPAFNDKGHSARRRTFIIPFTQRFESDPTFEERTFNSQMFGRLIAEMCRYAQRLKEQGYRYKFSAETLDAKIEYDAEANNAEEYAHYIIRQGVVAFDDFRLLRMDYENWCAEHGYVPLGMGNWRRAVKGAGFDRISVREGEGVAKRYILTTVQLGDLIPLGMGRPGLFTTLGFVPHNSAEVPEFKEEEPVIEPTKSILNDRW